VSGPARLRNLLAAPHRLGFFAGAVMLAVASLWWGSLLALRFGAVEVPWQVSPTTAHALLMVYGFMPLFFAGFLFTAGPRWLMLQPVPARALLVPVAAIGLGWLAGLAGVHTAVWLAALGLSLVALGMALLTGRFALLVMQSRAPDRDHARIVLLGCSVAVAGLWLAALGTALGHDPLARAAAHLGLWGGAGLVFASVAHRMIPFFTAAALPALEAWRPRALLMILVALVGAQAPWAVADALAPQAGPALLLWLRAAVELAGGALLLWLALRWGLVQSLRLRLLAMLHMGFFWLGVALALAGVSHALMAASGGMLSLGLAPLHAFTMGYLGTTLVAMATRVVCGHGGRTLVADNWAWAIFWALQVGVVCRVVAALWPTAQVPFTLLAAQFWLAAVCAWALRYGRWLLEPRIDGQPG
jgi:uncharacterized protein involved in response to NO